MYGLSSLLNHSLSISLHLYFFVIHFAELILSLWAPLVIVEAQVVFNVSVRADRDVATSLNVNVFSVSNMTANFAQGKINCEPF